MSPRTRTSTSLLAGVFAVLALAPASMRSEGLYQGFSGSLTIREQALGDRALLRQQRRQRGELRRLCQATGTGSVACPDVNDASAVRRTLRDANVERNTNTGATTSGTSRRLRLQDLTDEEASLLRRAQRARACSRLLDLKRPGLGRLCRSIVGTPERPRGFLNDRANLEQSRHPAAPTLEDRVEMSKGARPDR